MRLRRRLLSCDNATVAGFAWREGDELVACASLKESKALANVHRPWRLKFYPIRGRAVTPADHWFPTELAAYALIGGGWLEVEGESLMLKVGRAPDCVVSEKGHGDHHKSVYLTGWRNGYVACAAHNAGVLRVQELNNSSWAGRVGKHYGDPFPRASEARKRHSVRLAQRLGIDLPAAMHDVADAIWIGFAAQIAGM